MDAHFILFKYYHHSIDHIDDPHSFIRTPTRSRSAVAAPTAVHFKQWMPQSRYKLL
jgi:hypothetical protein